MQPCGNTAEAVDVDVDAEETKGLGQETGPSPTYLLGSGQAGSTGPVAAGPYTSADYPQHPTLQGERREQPASPPNRAPPSVTVAELRFCLGQTTATAVGLRWISPVKGHNIAREAARGLLPSYYWFSFLVYVMGQASRLAILSHRVRMAWDTAC